MPDIVYKKRKRRKKGSANSTAVIVSMLVTVSVLIFLFLFVFNKWTVNVTLNGDEKIVLEQGDKYEEKGASAEAHGSFLFKEPRKLTVKQEGKVDSAKAGGKYEIRYEAHYLWIKGEAVRTVVIADHTPPVIELKNDPEAFTKPGEEYKEEGYKATDNVDGDITSLVKKEIKDGVVIYTVEDSSGNVVTAERQIKYKDPDAPVLTLKGDSKIEIKSGERYEEPGFTATDVTDGDLSDKVTVEGEVNIFAAGEYVLKYSVKDSFGNVSTAQRTVTVKPSPQQPNQEVKPDGKVIYLTFDDGPSTTTTPKLLDVLAKYNVKVTFFVIDANHDLIKREYDEGHSVAIHSATHDYNKIYANDQAFFDDLNQMNSVIEQATGHKTKLMRFPGGSSNTISAHSSPGIMTRLTQEVRDAGFQYFDWNVSSGDAGETTSTDQVYENVINGCNGRDVSVVLQHDIKDFSVDAVERIINWGLSNGYTFLPLQYDSPAAHHGVNN